MTSSPAFDYYIALSLETTDADPHEIIRWSMITIEATTLDRIAIFDKFVRPALDPILSDRCVEKTGISQRSIIEADFFDRNGKGVYAEAIEFIQIFTNAHGGNKKIAIITSGDSDLKKILPGQCSRSAVNIVSPFFMEWINLPRAYWATMSIAVKPSLKNLTASLGLPSSATDVEAIAAALVHIIKQNRFDLEFNGEAKPAAAKQQPYKCVMWPPEPAPTSGTQTQQSFTPPGAMFDAVSAMPAAKASVNTSPSRQTEPIRRTMNMTITIDNEPDGTTSNTGLNLSPFSQPEPVIRQSMQTTENPEIHADSSFIRKTMNIVNMVVAPNQGIDAFLQVARGQKEKKPAEDKIIKEETLYDTNGIGCGAKITFASGHVAIEESSMIQ